eukprot:5994797-Alexandrium_andersonii.AAC.1
MRAARAGSSGEAWSAGLWRVGSPVTLFWAALSSSMNSGRAECALFVQSRSASDSGPIGGR